MTRKSQPFLEEHEDVEEEHSREETVRAKALGGNMLGLFEGSMAAAE